MPLVRILMIYAVLSAPRTFAQRQFKMSLRVSITASAALWSMLLALRALCLKTRLDRIKKPPVTDRRLSLSKNAGDWFNGKKGCARAAPEIYGQIRGGPSGLGLFDGGVAISLIAAVTVAGVDASSCVVVAAGCPRKGNHIFIK